LNSDYIESNLIILFKIAGYAILAKDGSNWKAPDDCHARAYTQTLPHQSPRIKVFDFYDALKKSISI